jgi:prophage regulatory protein
LSDAQDIQCNLARGEEMSSTILRLPAVIARTGLSRSTLYVLVAAGTFPQPIGLGARAIGWLETDVESWIMQRIELGRRHSPKTSTAALD